MWQWPATFIEIYLPRLIEMGRIDQKFADALRADLAARGKESKFINDYATRLGDHCGKDYLRLFGSALPGRRRAARRLSFVLF